ncbi:STAS domain-containing protein [Cryptosporangium phraense]|uniref:Anti-sigma factor antagonist n=1 Tax=Cryptosporangium phraense TaxID=2593070 RepID=A0A545ARA0_9ACTN|nr:STAS domain-containing protein [Cryptosporangium phraense]TQS43859.1 STAS domain-containing protein [Cryptosporangium phraense]
MSLQVSVEHVDDVARCVIVGEVDMATTPQLRDELLGLVDAGERYLVLDVSGVPFLDSTGLGVLMEVHRRLRDVSGSVALVGARPALVRLLTITNLSRALPVYRSVEDATDAVGGHSAAEVSG